MEYDCLLACWEQRNVLLTAILNLTGQIEVQSSQLDIRLGDLPEQRQVYIDRLKKCNRMIDGYKSKAGETERARLREVLSGKADPAECTEEERRLADCAQKSRRLLDSTLASDTEARRKIRLECDRLRKRIRSARRKAGAASRPSGSPNPV